MNAEHWKKQAEIYRENLLEAKKLFDSKFTLTDEEILFIADKVDIPDEPDTKDLIEFARAILRKAQEK